MASNVTNARTAITMARQAGSSVGGISELKFPQDIDAIPHKMIICVRTRQKGATTLEKDKISKAIVLPTPLNVSETYQASYESRDLGNIGEFIANRASELVGAAENAGGGFSGAMAGVSSAVGGAWDDMKNNAGSYAAGVGYQMAVNLTSKFAGPYANPGAVQGAIASGTGMILNPHKTAIFTGINLRQFNYEWTLAPKSRKESESVENIVRTLRNAMLPPRGKNGVFLLFPDEVEYKILGPDHGFDMPTTPCVITGVTLNRTGGGMPAFFASTGAPVIYRLSLNLFEIKALTRDDFNNTAAAETAPPTTPVVNTATTDATQSAYTTQTGYF